jgi:hypothetical protein
MKQSICIGLIAAAFLAGCGKSRIEAAHDLVKDGLSDPDSALFKDDREYAQKDGKVVVCGRVNAKNRMGGYVGYRMYIVEDEKALVMNEDNASDFAGKYMAICTSQTASQQ